MRHYKKESEEKFSEGEFHHDVWDIKKIAVGFVMLLVLVGGGIYGLKYLHLLPDVSYILSRKPTKTVAGASIKQGEAALPVSQHVIQQKLNDLKKQVNNLNVKDLTQNSPQAKKLQLDLQSLTKLPGNAAKDECLRICNGL